VPIAGVGHNAAMEDERTIRRLQALAQQTRLDVVRLLAAEGALPASVIAERLGVQRTAMSANLKVLAHADIVRGDRAGRTITYGLRREALHELSSLLGQILGGAGTDPAG